MELCSEQVNSEYHNFRRELCNQTIFVEYHNFFLSLQPTSDKRTWVVNPIDKNPWWLPIAAVIPALLATILIFMDQQITAVIVNRKENKLKVYYIPAIYLT